MLIRLLKFLITAKILFLHMCWRHLFLTENTARATASSSRASPPFRTLRRSRTFVSDLANFFRVLACQRSRDPAEAGDGGRHRSRGHLMLVGAGAGGLHRRRGGFMLVMPGDGVHCDRHRREAGVGDGQAIRCDDSHQRQHHDPVVERPSS